MPVTLYCPNLKCRVILQVPERARGKKVRCAACQTTFYVPQHRSDGQAESRPAAHTAETDGQ